MKYICITILFLCVFVGYAKAQQSTADEEKVIYITGAVFLPSKVKITERMTLTEAIARAGGVSKNGSKNVSIFRPIPGTKDREIIKVDLMQIKKGKAEDLLLQPLDIIEISFRKGIRVTYPSSSSDYLIL